ncbi:MAG: response regulator transcription factor [Natronospirillum sp.]|uniref:response regulator n=1 Tax=Natronospirillum sp. TaxID=2812955 RepID=UPI0025F4FB34|nr:response regulator transcription factor [Natronospirillum sp.]MCH8553378.1 response regulator transcription factor [Natronospirillum sp.]
MAEEFIPLRILLLEDNQALRERFARIMDQWSGACLVASCATLQQALEVLQTTSVDLLIADLDLPDGHGAQAIRRLRELHTEAEAMVITALADENSVLDAIEAGAAGYLLKDAESFELIEAIEELRAGRSPISTAIARVLVRRMSKAAPEGQAPRLTPREVEILQGIAKGFTYAELGEWLGISHQTVPVHIKNIYRKLSANNRSEAVYEAQRWGLLRS